jgi:hypothetical protein
MLHMNNVGLYDGLFVMQDEESKTLWNHITGQAMYGPHVGKSLGPVRNMVQMNVQQALELDPDMAVAISDRPYTGRYDDPEGGMLSANAELMDFFVETLGEEDDRRPRMDMGLGIWTGQTQRYYPMETLRARNGAFIDQVDGRNLLVFLERRSMTPTAMYVDADSATVDDGDVRLSSGQVVRAGILYDADGNQLERELPQQTFTRWYGYILTFPGAEVFGQ